MNLVTNHLTISAAINLREPLASQRDHAWIKWAPRWHSLWGQRLLTSVTSEDLEQYAQDSRKEGLSQAGIHSSMTVLRAIFAVAGLPLPRRATNDERLRHFEDDEEARLRAVMHLRDFACVTLAATTGLRGMELWNLRCKDVDLKAGVIHLPGERERTVPTGDPSNWPVTRNGNAFVVMPLGHEKYKDRAESFRLFQKYAFRPALRAASIENFIWGDLRNEAAKRWLAAGATVIQVQKALGLSLTTPSRFAHLAAQLGRV